MSTRRAGLLFALGALAIVVLAAAFAPYVFPEFEHLVHGPNQLVGPPPSGPVKGRWFDDYFLIEQLDPATFAIGEPRYYQGNYSYLIIGSERAVLYDAGSGTRDIVPVVRSLTTLPITVIPSHLHYDHVGALGRFDRTALLDLRPLRARIHDSQLTLERYEFMGFIDDLPEPTFRVDEWWGLDSEVNLGQRRLRVLWTPGHTPNSVSLYDQQRGLLFAGDFLYPGHLYAFLPGASRHAYLDTARRLLATIDPSTRVLTAHMANAPAAVAAPVLAAADLRALETALVGIQQGKLASIGFYPRVFAVRGSVTFATGWSWNDR